MELLTTVILVFLIGFVASMVGGMAAGAGFITIPLLTILGLPPHIAIGTSKVGMLAMKAAAFVKYIKAKKVVWKYVLPLCIVSVIGSVIGANLLIQIPEKLLSLLIGVIILVFLPFIFIHKNAGVKRRKVSRLRTRFGYLCYGLVAVWAAFFGAGSGFFALYTFAYLFGLTILEAKGTSKMPQFLLDGTAIAIFAYHGIINYFYAAVLVVSMMLGGYIGAHIGVKKGDAWVKVVIGVVIFLSAIKLIFF
ncbi:sulfite exporter TauE/SafE family protein [Nanoarchaeota archaeon]